MRPGSPADDRSLFYYLLADYLRPDEEVLERFPAVQAAAVDDPSFGPGPLSRLGADRTVVSTRERVFVLKDGYYQPMGELLAEQPRSVPIAKRKPAVGNWAAAHGHYQIEIGSQILLVSELYGSTLPWADHPADAPPPADHEAHVQGRVCKLCGKPIETGVAARRRGDEQWAHEVCPEF
jgi:hypothetical protein